MTAAQPLIAIIDDDADVLSATARLLRACGFRPEPFSSAEAFLAREGRDEPRCLIVDIQLPGMSGIELQRRLKADGSRLPVIFITGAPDEATRGAAADAGCVAYLGKPFDADQLVDAIRNAIG